MFWQAIDNSLDVYSNYISFAYMKKYAVIVAGGSGQRMGGDIPKQFLLLNGQSLLQHTILAFANTFADIEIIVVLPLSHLATGERLVNDLHLSSSFHFIAGGATRFHSVKNGLTLVESPSIIFVHDAVRCLVKTDLIKRCYEQTMIKGSAVPAINSTDSIRLQTDIGSHTIDRNTVKIIQTPQTFKSELLLPAFQQDYKENFTDEATVVELYGQPVFLIEGEYTNLKITHPIDLLIAEQLMEASTA